MSSESRYLLIVSCSQRKRSDPGLLPAIERYDGVNFRVLAKARREGYWPENLDLLILSAKYGLLTPDAPIEDYDRQMTKHRASRLQVQVGSDLDQQLRGSSYREVFINLGKPYLITLEASEELDKLRGRVSYATGGIGKKMAQMKKWLQRIDARMEESLNGS